MSLIEMTSKREADEFYAEAIRQGITKYGFWTGAERDPITNTFRWRSTGAELDYENFKEGEPNNTENSENCVFVMLWGNDPAAYIWNDCNCEVCSQLYGGFAFGAACYRPSHVKKCIVLPNYDFLYITKALANEYI